jgi:hypothetical protein
MRVLLVPFFAAALFATATYGSTAAASHPATRDMNSSAFKAGEQLPLFWQLDGARSFGIVN